jgi:excinuclease ABC subunit A
MPEAVQLAKSDMDGPEERGVIRLTGVQTHNLKNIDVEIPQGVMTVISGVSGSGKSSLAFDTLYAEGQRRYTESLSTYARQFLDRMERPPVEAIRNIQPALALRQKNEVSNARSTVGTITEVDDHLQLVYTHIGTTYCPNCDHPVERDTVPQAVSRLNEEETGTRVIVVAEADATDEEHRPAVLKHLVQEGYRRLYTDGEMVDITESDFDDLLDREWFPVVIDRLAIGKGEGDMRTSEAIEAAFNLGKGRAEVFFWDDREREPLVFDQAFRCNTCGKDFVQPQPALFSYNSSLGACDECSGYGKVMGIDMKKVIPNPAISLEDDAVACFSTPKYKRHKEAMLDKCREHGIAVDVPFYKLSEQHQEYITDGGDDWMGIRGFFKGLQSKQYKTHVRIFLAKYRGYDRCPECKGSRLNQDARNVKVDGRPISDVWDMRIEQADEYYRELELPDDQEARVATLLEEIRHRLDYLTTIGCGYLTLGRQSRTLSGGEMQRIHLTTSLGRALTDTLYVLDEPTAGLHARDSEKLLEVLYELRDLGNTVVVVEHDPDIIEGADHVIELGPRGGEEGGEILFAGPIDAFRGEETLTSQTLRRRKEIEPTPTEAGDSGFRVVNATANNLDGLTVEFPYNRLIAVSGVSGSGKSTLCEDVLYNGWKRLQGRGGVEAGAAEALEGLDEFDDVVLMDQSAVGRSTRSNALSYTGAFDDVRKLFSRTRDAKLAGLTIGDFSFNTPGGRCENCQGTGTIRVEMHFMADVEVTCEECTGKRYNERVLGVGYRGMNIADVFEMTVSEALEFFAHHEPLVRKLTPLREVGLSYLRVGQTTATLSGGEAQRLKLATYVAEGRKRGETKPVLFIFDEPTVGLHLLDVEVLVSALRKLVDHGHSVVVIEHNIDFIAQCDHVIDLGPGAGPRGGQLVAEGTPRQIAAASDGYTCQYLFELFEASAAV